MYRQRCRFVVFVAILLFASVAGAQPSIWVDADTSAVSRLTNRLVVPDQYRLVRLDASALAAALAHAPLELVAGPRPVVALPMPDGKLSRFEVVESPIIEPAMAARYPDIKTYRGHGLDDRTATTRFGLTTAGFHAIVLSGSGTAYIDPYSRDKSDYYVAYWKRDYRDPHAASWSCSIHGRNGNNSTVGDESGAASLRAGTDQTGSVLHTYKLALAANYEYTQFHSGGLPNLPSKEAALAGGMIPTMNRVNALYERDLSIRMILIDNQLIIWDQPADPYVNEDGISMLVSNQATLDLVVGNANYDIGHVFSTGGGGVAGLGVVCDPLLVEPVPTSLKAWGVTGNPSPIGDPFDVDYVAHEMGHQFGGNHTFNGTTGSCSGSNRNADTAYEVGSGSTIMAYAGICGAQNLQPNSDDLFHNISLVEITSYSRAGNGNNCGGRLPLANNPPAVNAGPDVTIPSRTPFVLTAEASDPDGDAITYAWEEFDRGPANDGNTDNGSSPILRPFNAVTSPSRTFPKLADVLNDTSSYGEKLPTTGRTMKFRVTVRDNAAGGGQYAYDETDVTSVATAGPFQVTQPAAGTVWAPGELRNVEWDVANTNAPPINADSVRIRFSTDGGQTFPLVLVESTLNDGAETVTVPEVHAPQARVRVEPVGHVFFHISKPISVIPPGLPLAVNDTAATAHNTSVLISVLANDSDPDGGTLQVVAVQSPTNRGGTAVIEGNAVRYTPAHGFAGTDRFSYTISDGKWQASAVVTVEVATLCPPSTAAEFIHTFEPAAKPGWQVQTAVNRNAVKANWQVMIDPLAQSLPQSFFGDAGALSVDLKDDRLVAPAQNLTAASQLIFWHRFEFEGGATGFDGGVLEVSLDGGATWSDVGVSSFKEGGYNSTMSPSFGSPIAGRRAWSGRLATMTRVEVNLGSFAGFGVLVRWRLTGDPFVLGTRPGAGWWIDNVQFTNRVDVPSTCALPPIAIDDAATVPARTQTIIPVLGNDSDPNGDTLTVGSVTQPSHGTVTNNGSSVSYQPVGEFVGEDSFTYSACDPGGLCDTATVAVTVVAVNRAPEAGDDSATTTENTAVSISVLANDADPDGDPLAIGAISAPSNGTATNSGDGTIKYTPNTGFAGADSFTYQACDPEPLCATATVTVTVEDDGVTPAFHVAGGGWFAAGADKAHVGANARGGIAPSGKFSYWIGDFRVKGVVAGATREGTSHAVLTGPCELKDGSRCTFRARLEDNADPGEGADRVEVEIFRGDASIHKAGGVLGGGDINVE